MSAPSKEVLEVAYDRLSATLKAFEAKLVERYLVTAEVALGEHGENVGFGKVEGVWKLYVQFTPAPRQALLSTNILLRRQAAMKLDKLVDALEVEQTKQLEAVRVADQHVAGEFARLVR